MTLLEELQWRGFMQDATFEDINLLNKGEWILYIGFDASAPSQTVGNLAPMMAVKVFLKHGHKAIILAGGATSLIGDPGGKDTERVLQDKEDIRRNTANAQKQFNLIFKDEAIRYVNNLDWYRSFNVLDFLREVGKNFSMTPLIKRDYIASRLGEAGDGISYAEFSYTLLQGYDYLKLFEDYQCNLQLGGSDQWGNCLSGVDLIRRKHQEVVHAITLPLIINRATGKKFGKSEEQTVWLDPNLTHPSDFYQFWLNTPDDDALDYLKVFTTLNKEEIDKISQKQTLNPAGRAAQRKLAEETTVLVHGDKNLKICRLFAKLAFELPGQSIETLDYGDVKKILEEEPEEYKVILRRTPANTGDPLENLFDELLKKIPALESRSQLKELVKNKAIKFIASSNDSFYEIKSLNELRDQKEYLMSIRAKTLILILIGKNTIRATGYEDSD